MEITKVVKPFIRRGWPNTFGNKVYVKIIMRLNVLYRNVTMFMKWRCYKVVRSISKHTYNDYNVGVLQACMKHTEEQSVTRNMDVTRNCYKVLWGFRNSCTMLIRLRVFDCLPVQLPVYLVWPHVCLDHFENDAQVASSLQMEHCHRCGYN